MHWKEENMKYIYSSQESLIWKLGLAYLGIWNTPLHMVRFQYVHVPLILTQTHTRACLQSKLHQDPRLPSKAVWPEIFSSPPPPPLFHPSLSGPEKARNVRAVLPRTFSILLSLLLHLSFSISFFICLCLAPVSVCSWGLLTALWSVAPE